MSDDDDVSANCTSISGPSIDADIRKWKKNVIAKRGYYTSKNSEKFIACTLKKSEEFIATPYKTEGTWEEINPIKSIIE